MDLHVAEARLKEIASLKAELNREEARINQDILTLHDNEIAALYKAKGEPFGSVNVEADDFTLNVTIPKKIEWDQDKLTLICADIRDNGADPSEYMTVEYGVPESKYKAWPEAISKQFEPARTVMPGKAKLVIKRKGDEQ